MPRADLEDPEFLSLWLTADDFMALAMSRNYYSLWENNEGKRLTRDEAERILIRAPTKTVVRGGSNCTVHQMVYFRRRRE